MFLFNINCLITLQTFIEHYLCDSEMNNIIYNIFNKENNLFNAFIQMKQFINVFEKIMFKLHYISETQISISIYLVL